MYPPSSSKNTPDREGSPLEAASLRPRRALDRGLAHNSVRTDSRPLRKRGGRFACSVPHLLARLAHGTCRSTKMARASSILRGVDSATLPIRFCSRRVEIERMSSVLAKLGRVRPPSGGSIWMCVGMRRWTVVMGTTITSCAGPAFSVSAETMSAGRVRPCSWPRTGSRSTYRALPRSGGPDPGYTSSVPGVLKVRSGNGVSHSARSSSSSCQVSGSSRRFDRMMIRSSSRKISRRNCSTAFTTRSDIRLTGLEVESGSDSSFSLQAKLARRTRPPSGRSAGTSCHAVPGNLGWRSML